MKLRKTFPELSVQMIEDSSANIIQKMLSDTVPAFGTIRSFHDYPQIKISEELLSNELKIIGHSKNKIVALASPNNPILNKYDSISIESLLTKPLIIHAPYSIEDNDYYKLLKNYGTPQIKYITSNLQTYYEIMRDSDCISLGAISDNIYSMTNSLFSKEQQLRAIPIRENITFTKYRLINKKLNNSNNTLLRDLIIDSFL